MNVEKDLWTYLSETQKPIVMYGMGNGADKILERFEKLNIKVSDFFASDGFVRGHSFHGKTVLSFSEIKEKYEDFIIILSFASSLDNVLDLFYNLNDNYEMYAPDVPVTGEGTFTLEYYKKNEEKFKKARDFLSDDFSKKVFDNVISFTSFHISLISSKSLTEKLSITAQRKIVSLSAYCATRCL